MKNFLVISVISFLLPNMLKAQHELRLKPVHQPKSAVQAAKIQASANVNQAQQSATIWSEDFSNGIPTSWVNQGYSDGPGGLTPNPNCNWEFRGSNTTPDNTVGSRGTFSDGRTIASKTPGDFLIFDSGYLDNGGMQPLGMGSCPSPHVGSLTTDTIDLSAHNEIDLFFHSMAYKFVANFEIAFSSDGGLTFPDTVQVLPNLGINSATEQDDIMRVDPTPYIGGASNAMIAFIFDGGLDNNNNPNGDGYYYWQIDDIEIREKPEHRLDFNALVTGLPNKLDISADGKFDGYPKEGFTMPSQAKPMEFKASLTNSGTETQKNIRFNVDIYDGSNLVQSASSQLIDSLVVGDTLFSNQLITDSVILNQPANYSLEFYATSDSITKANNNWYNNPDTLNINVNDSTVSMDFNSIDNYVGGNNNLIGMAVRLHLNSAKNMKGVYANISPASDSTGSIIVEVYDTTGFAYGTFGGPVGSPLYVEAFSLTGSDVNQGYKYMKFNSPVNLSAGGYLIVLNLIPSATNGEINIANDKSLNQTGSSGMLTGNGTWFSNFASSLTFNAPHIRAVMEADFSVNFNINHVTCPYDSTGSITAIISSPGSHTYQWSNGDTTSMADSLKPGYYTLNITTGNATQNYTIQVKSIADSINYTASVNDETCLNANDGSITVNAQGDGPLSYLWNTSDTTASIQNLSPGAYSLTITDSLGCSKNLSFTVDSSNSSIVKPSLTLSDSLIICQGDSISLGVTNNYINYEWSNSAVTNTISPSVSGDYFVKVDNGSSCFKYSDTLHLAVKEPYDSLEICMVTFDYNEFRNKAIFTNPQMPAIDSILLYQKEDPGNPSFTIAGHSTGFTNEIVDTVDLIIGALPAHQYSLRLTDTCGNRSDLSPVHTSMTMGTSKNANGNAELSWTPYMGNPVSKYRIYKTTDQFNSFTLIDSVGSTVNNYVDQNANDSDYYYLVEAVFSNTLPCSNGPFEGSIIVARYNPLGLSENAIEKFKIFPVPTKGSLTIVNPENEKRQYKLTTIDGKIVRQGILQPGQNTTDLSDLSKGIYFFRVPGKVGAIKISKN